MNAKHTITTVILLKIFCQFKSMIFNGHYSTSNPRYIYFFYCSADTRKHFDCTNQGFFAKNEMLRLYLTSDDLVRSTDSTLQPFTFLLAPCAKPVQSPSTGFRLREVKFYINNNDNWNGEPRCFPQGSCLTTWKEEHLGPEDESKGVGNVLRAESDTPRGEGHSRMGSPLKPVARG